MPAKPSWYGRLDEIVALIEALPYPWVDRVTLQELLRVGPRRAQQIMRPIATALVWGGDFPNSMAARDDVLAHLRCLAAGDTAQYERNRRNKLAATIDALRTQAMAHPRVLVEAPVAVVNQRFADLSGVTVAPGMVSVVFTTPAEALQKLLALAMAIGNDFAGFEAMIAPLSPYVPPRT